MSKYLRNKKAGGTYFFTVVTFKRKPILEAQVTIDLLRRAFRETKASYPFKIDAVVILPDHLHTIWTLPETDCDYSIRWQTIKRKFSLFLKNNASDNKTGKVWQPRFWEHTIRDQEDYNNHMDYIHYNPVKHGYVKYPIAWKHSSLSRLIRKNIYAPEWGEQEPDNIKALSFE